MAGLSRLSGATAKPIPKRTHSARIRWASTSPSPPSAGPLISRSGQMTCSPDSVEMPDLLPVAIAATSALIAFFNAADNHHKPVRARIGEVGHLVVSPCVLTEFDYLVASRSGPGPARAALGYINGRVATGRWEVPPIGPSLTAA